MRCIVCGGEAKRIRFYGTKGGMTVTACCRHVHSFRSCEKISCEVDIRNILKR